jgi:1,4-dihydroxy-6-naphthoate synthase
MAEHKIDLRGYQFEHRLEDIQTLNERAMRGELDISAISIHAYAYVSDRYALSALRREHGRRLRSNAGRDRPGAAGRFA